MSLSSLPSSPTLLAAAATRAAVGVDVTTEREELMLSFLSQMRERLQATASIDEFRNWVNENLPDIKQNQQYPPAYSGSWKDSKEASEFKQRKHKCQTSSTPQLSLLSLKENGMDDNANDAITDSAGPVTKADRCSFAGNFVFVKTPFTALQGTDSILLTTPNAQKKKPITCGPLHKKNIVSPVRGHDITGSPDSRISIRGHDEGNMGKDVVSFLHLSFSWTSNILFRGGLEIFGANKRRHGDESNPLGYSASMGNMENTTSLLTASDFYATDGTTKALSMVGATKKKAPVATSISSLSAVYRGRHGAISPVRRATILDSCSHLNFAEGMPVFSMEERLPGQRLLFSRQCTRHSAVFRPVEEVQEALRAVKVPFMPDVDLQDVDINYYWKLYGSNCYVYTCMNILLRYNFANRFGFDVRRLHCYYSTALTYIRARNPFHNPCQAADIVLAIHQFLIQPYFAENFTDEELFAIIFAATVMRLGHIGVTNAFMLKVRHPYACVHSFYAPLQSVSLSLAFAILESPECYFPTFSTNNNNNINSSNNEDDDDDYHRYGLGRRKRNYLNWSLNSSCVLMRETMSPSSLNYRRYYMKGLEQFCGIII
ncbi:3'5'-cyclic nucleotide phosphodiesterase [Trypanosoma melophagium]|uniref:3'5'-cyclic nucleotide phosphodiesterase n=1 Tax=Trypanosoma melophagium TaxID=715481 RepID=UPI00351A03BB|nr:3'5'-cyclic nucleotide phosphodiesterase [Trypanosoma melophagium]